MYIDGDMYVVDSSGKYIKKLKPGRSIFNEKRVIIIEYFNKCAELLKTIWNNRVLNGLSDGLDYADPKFDIDVKVELMPNKSLISLNIISRVILHTIGINREFSS